MASDGVFSSIVTLASVIQLLGLVFTMMKIQTAGGSTTKIKLKNQNRTKLTINLRLARQNRCIFNNFIQIFRFRHVIYEKSAIVRCCLRHAPRVHLVQRRLPSH